MPTSTMQRIPKYQSTWQKLQYSKGYRFPRWAWRKWRHSRLQAQRDYLVDMRLGHQISLRPTQSYLRNVIFSGQYHDDNIFFLRRFLKDRPVIFDLGANIGLYSCAYATHFKHLSPKIYAFEALANNFSYLQKNIALNELSEIEPLLLAVGDHQGELSLNLPDDDFIGNAVGNNIAKKEDRQPGKEVTVPLTTLDHFCEQNQVSRCDFIKIDIEGAEPLALKGARRTIERFRPVIQAEHNGYWLRNAGMSFQDFVRFFDGLNYQVAVERKDHFEVLSEPQSYEPELELIDLLFVPMTSMEHRKAVTQL